MFQPPRKKDSYLSIAAPVGSRRGLKHDVRAMAPIPHLMAEDAAGPLSILCRIYGYHQRISTYRLASLDIKFSNQLLKVYTTHKLVCNALSTVNTPC